MRLSLFLCELPQVLRRCEVGAAGIIGMGSQGPARTHGVDNALRRLAPPPYMGRQREEPGSSPLGALQQQPAPFACFLVAPHRILSVSASHCNMLHHLQIQ